MIRVITYNVNGIRSAVRKGFLAWLAQQNADVVCLQETKAQYPQVQELYDQLGDYHAYYRDATVKKGYSGVAIFSKRKPDEVLVSLDWTDFDEEGRYLELRFGSLSIVSLYLPSGSSGQARQTFKFAVMQWLSPILKAWLRSGRQYILCGDWNIVRSSLDIHHWRANQTRSGCLPEERAWLNQLCANHPEMAQTDGGCGWVDSYRMLHPTGQDYTWWSQRANARAKNIGWRIDYQLVTPDLLAHLQHCEIARDVRLSDHAPYRVDYRL